MRLLRCLLGVVAVIVALLAGASSASARTAIHAYGASGGAPAEAIDRADLSEARTAGVSHENATPLRLTGGASHASLTGPAAVMLAGGATNTCAGYASRAITRYAYGNNTAKAPWDPQSLLTDAAIGTATAGALHHTSRALTNGIGRYRTLSRGQHRIPTRTKNTTTPSRPGSYANWGDEISDGARMVDQPFGLRGIAPDFADGARSPGAGFEWRGTGSPRSRRGNWHNPRTGESLHPDLGHPGPIGPHYDYKAPDGTWYRIFQDGRMEPK